MGGPRPGFEGERQDEPGQGTETAGRFGPQVDDEGILRADALADAGNA